MASVFDFHWGLPPRALQPARHQAPTHHAADVPADVVNTWKKITRQCPHTRPSAVKRWLQSQPELRDAVISEVIAVTGVLKRKMPDDFIDTIFEINTPARLVLTDLLSRFEDPETLEIHGEEFALVVKSTCATTLIRPAPDGVFVAISMKSANDHHNAGRSIIHHVTVGQALPIDIMVALEFARLQI
jgi:hypothetical protein